jgi:uncharacterized protein (TIGR00369 family)
MPTEVRAWIEESPYCRDLGVKLKQLDEQGCTLELPYVPQNTNGLALHGGVQATLASLSAQVAMRHSSRNGEIDPCSVALQLDYVRGVRDQTVTAVTRLLRRTRDLGFFETHMHDASGALIAHATSTIGERRSQALDDDAVVARKELDTQGIHLFNEAVDAIPFLKRREVQAIGGVPGCVELSLPAAAHNLDLDGRIHEGALLTVLDASGATCPWTKTAPTASAFGVTVALQAQVFARPAAQALIARATEIARSGQLCWCSVELFGAEDRKRCAIGSVAYRFGNG